jgi:hypothetical protein
MNINRFDLGDEVRLSAEFKTSAGVATDPGGVTLKFRYPGGPVTTYVYGTDNELVRDSSGNYHADIFMAAVGRWHYRFEGTGTSRAAAEHEFVVSPSRFD